MAQNFFAYVIPNFKDTHGISLYITKDIYEMPFFVDSTDLSVSERIVLSSESSQWRDMNAHCGCWLVSVCASFWILIKT